MDYLEAKINQLVVENPVGQKTFVRSFTTKPRGTTEKVGKIFGLIEIGATQPKISDLIDLIIEEVKNNYYFSPDLESGEEPPSVGEKFEAALKKTNLIIASFLESEQISLDLEKVNIIIAIINNQELHFALVGNVSAILFYNINRDNYRIINILETAQTLESEPNPLKLFSQIISGRIKLRDILFISTSNILDYFSLERIKNIITENLPKEGITQLKQFFQQTSSKENFGALTLELEKTTIPLKKTLDITEFNYRQAASSDSIKELIRTEKETEKLLTPSFLPEIKKYVISLKAAFQNYLDKVKTTTTILHKKPISIHRPNIKFQPTFKPAIKSFGKISKVSKEKLQPHLLLLKKLFSVLINHPLWGKLSELINRLFGNLILKFKRLPKSSKVLLVITIILVILFTQNIIWLGYKNNREKKIERVNEVITDVTMKKNEAEASLIYRDEEQARQLLINAKNLLTNLKPLLEAQKEQITILTKDIEEQLQQLRHIMAITEPIQIVNFQNLDNQAKIAKLAILRQRTLYTQNQNNQSIYKANLDTRVMSAIYSPNSNTGNFKLGVAINDNELIFFNDSMSAFRLDPNDDTLETLAININDNAHIADATAYNNRLYLLDTANNQVYRYSKITTGYGNSQGWLQEEANLADATALTIDGSVYILKNNGEILKFENGKQVDFKINIIDPRLESPAKIKTTETSKYLYILDPPTKRLVVLDKDGNLINQYTSESFSDLKDFLVIEAEKEIYILAGNSVFGVPAEHLK